MSPAGKRLLLKALGLIAVQAVAQNLIPFWPAVHIPPVLLGRKALQTVTLDQAVARVRTSLGRPTVSVLYLTTIPGFLRSELASDVRRWEQGGAAVHAFAIDPPGDRYRVSGFVHDAPLDLPPLWIRMPGGEQCALEQLRAVNEFTGQQIADPEETIPLLVLVLRNAQGLVMTTKAVTVPNGEAIAPEDLEHAIAPFDLYVRRALR